MRFKTKALLTTFGLTALTTGGIVGYTSYVRKQSPGSLFFEAAMRLTRKDHEMNPDQAMENERNRINRLRSRVQTLTKPDLDNEIYEETFESMQVFTVSPLKKTSRDVVLYIHGGAYVEEMSPFQWGMIDDLVTETGATVIIPNYPLAPVYTYPRAYEKLLDLYQAMLARYYSEDIIFMGECAGGGLALGFAELLTEESVPLPRELILFSPWLDITVSNPDITPQLMKQDAILNKYNLIIDGQAWIGHDNPDSYLVSPINGPLEKLPPITILIGEYEIFKPDAYKFKELAEKAHVKVDLQEYPHMIHAFPIYPTREQHRVIKNLASHFKTNIK